IFISSDGERFGAFAQNVWDKIIQENDFLDCLGVLPADESKVLFKQISSQAEEILYTKFEDFEQSIILNTDTIKINKEKSFAFQEQQINRIGIENIRQARLNRLHKEKELWDSTYESAKQVVPA